MADPSPPVVVTEVKQVQVVIEKDRSVRVGLLILAVVLIVFSLTSAIISADLGGVIPILQTLADVFGILLGALLLYGILRKDKTATIAAYYSSLTLFGVMIATVILHTISMAIEPRVEFGNMPNEIPQQLQELTRIRSAMIARSLIMAILTLAVLAVTHFVIALQIKLTFGPKVSITPWEALTCVPCRGFKVMTKESAVVTEVPMQTS